MTKKEKFLCYVLVPNLVYKLKVWSANTRPLKCTRSRMSTEHSMHVQNIRLLPNVDGNREPSAVFLTLTVRRQSTARFKLKK